MIFFFTGLFTPVLGIEPAISGSDDPAALEHPASIRRECPLARPDADRRRSRKAQLAGVGAGEAQV